MTHLPAIEPELSNGMPRPMLPVAALLVNVSVDELAQLIAAEIPFNPLHTETGGLFHVDSLYDVLLETEGDGELFAIFQYAKKFVADYVIVSVKEQA